MSKERNEDETVDFLSESDVNINESDVPCICSQRWILGYLGFVFGTIFSMYRIDMSMAVVCMVKKDVTGYEILENGSYVMNSSFIGSNLTSESFGSREGCGEGIAHAHLEEENLSAEFTWDRNTQSVVLSAFFYGFVTTQIPGGWLAGRFGGKNVITASMTLSSIFMILIPVLARFHVTGVIIARILTGFVLGPLPPAWFSLLGKWALPNERGRMMMMFWIGQTAGSAIGITTSGVLCAHGFDNGWGSIFYLHGSTGIVFVIFWMCLAASSPNVHPRISIKEKRLISKYLHTSESKPDKVTNIPWLTIFTDVSVWAIFVTMLCDNWLYYLILTCLPMFVNEILKFDIQSNGFYSALPFIATVVSLLTSGVLADYVNKRRWVSRTTNRKIFQITSLVCSAGFLVMSCYLPCDKKQLVILCISVGTFFLNVAYSSGYPCNLVDMTPRFAPVLYAISNTIGASTGFVAPLVVGFLTKHKTIDEWRFVFWISAGIAAIGAVVYGLFSSSELVPWDQTTTTHTIEIEFNENGGKQKHKKPTGNTTLDMESKELTKSLILVSSSSEV